MIELETNRSVKRADSDSKLVIHDTKAALIPATVNLPLQTSFGVVEFVAVSLLGTAPGVALLR